MAKGNKITITTSTFSAVASPQFERLQREGFVFEFNPYGRRLSKAESVGLLDHAVAVIAGTEELDREVLESASDLRVISRCGTGIDNIDGTVLAERNILLYTTPDAPKRAVAELTIGLILDLLRHISETDRNIRGGKWLSITGNLLYGKTLGIVGLGRIGTQVAALSSVFGVRILAYDTEVKPDHIVGKYKICLTSLNQLLEESDIVSLHVPSLTGGHFLLTDEQFARMKNAAILINTARGSLIDEAALYRALTSGTIRGAAIDTFVNEPYSGPLAELPNVILTAHMGSRTIESRRQMEIDALENLIKGLISLEIIS